MPRVRVCLPAFAHDRRRPINEASPDGHRKSERGESARRLRSVASAAKRRQKVGCAFGLTSLASRQTAGVSRRDQPYQQLFLLLSHPYLTSLEPGISGECAYFAAGGANFWIKPAKPGWLRS